MKITKLLLLALILCLPAVGCHKHPTTLTKLPNGVTESGTTNGTDLGNSGVITNANADGSLGGVPMPSADKFKDWPRNEEIFKSDTVHFAFDSSVVKAEDKPKVSDVANYLKSNAGDAVQIEGHCDERGTEEYNRSLGERRALALREELIQMGVDGGNVITISYGKDKPVDSGHDEAAWSQNRRGVFILLTPPKAQ